MASEISDAEKKQVVLDSIRGIPDFPKKGILFWDVTTILLNHKAFQYTIDLFYEHYKDMKIDVVAGERRRRCASVHGLHWAPSARIQRSIAAPGL